MTAGNGSVLSARAQEFNWLLDSFVTRTPGVLESVGVSSDGLLMARSKGLDRPAAERLAAIVSGLISLGEGAARTFGFHGLNQVMVEMDEGFLFVCAISDGSALGVLTSRSCDIGLVGYEMTLLVERAGDVLTPEVVTQLKGHMLS